MLKLAAPLGFMIALASVACPARAQDCEGFWQNVKIGWHRNNEWPQPFVAADRSYAVAPFAVMIANGWQRQNLIGDNYFDENSKRLNSAGVECIRLILRQAPVEHRVIYIERDLNDEVTKMRVDAVQETVAALQPKGPMPEVVVSNMVPEGRSAEMVAAEFKGYTTSTPTPRLSGHSSGGASSASSGASTGGASSGTGGGAN